MKAKLIEKADGYVLQVEYAGEKKSTYIEYAQLLKMVGHTEVKENANIKQ